MRVIVGLNPGNIKIIACNEILSEFDFIQKGKEEWEVLSFHNKSVLTETEGSHKSSIC